MGKHRRPWWKPGGEGGTWSSPAYPEWSEPEPEPSNVAVLPPEPDEVVLVPVTSNTGGVTYQAVYRRFVRE